MTKRSLGFPLRPTSVEYDLTSSSPSSSSSSSSSSAQGLHFTTTWSSFRPGSLATAVGKCGDCLRSCLPPRSVDIFLDTYPPGFNRVHQGRARMCWLTGGARICMYGRAARLDSTPLVGSTSSCPLEAPYRALDNGVDDALQEDVVKTILDP